MAHMFTPPHPGLTLRDDVLPALGLTVTQAAQQLNVSRVTLSRVLNGRAASASDGLKVFATARPGRNPTEKPDLPLACCGTYHGR